MPIVDEKNYDELAGHEATYWGKRAKEKSDADVLPDLQIRYRAIESEYLWNDSGVEAFFGGLSL